LKLFENLEMCLVSKMEEKLERIRAWRDGKKMPPFTLDINPTDRCNLLCLSCWRMNEKFRNLDPSVYELKDEVIKRYVKEGIKFGIEEFEITGGGEPLMRKELVLELMKMIKEEGKWGNITTNGTLFEEEDITQIIEMGWDRITFSLDGPNAEINDYLRGKGCFETVVKNIRRFQHEKERMKTDKPILKFNVVISRINFRHLPEMIRLAKKMGIEIVHFDKMTVHSSIGEKIKVRKEEMGELKRKLIEAQKLADGYNILTNARELTSEPFVDKSNEMVELMRKDSGKDFNNLYCYEPWWHIVVKPDGSVQPCCLFDSKEENIKQKSLKQIWFGDYFERIRKSIMEREFFEFCKICNAGQFLENRRIREALKWKK